ncbi:DUF4433 domain-containing protein [Myxococcus sp. AM009]|uniref:DarT ssDNA thymidine ADP-ribosyltransferase family protein n=1 Tax=Myxococcus sp. AM009 TaxID=2745137 RepID=UPI00181C8251|nr:DarT ssDNA thymidine ADP-ribosyltransferase family protein [Myxococcus sp. AM009]NVJ01052.1 DUF4433 domain-containing protein [Myxococcus sp. AM009]
MTLELNRMSNRNKKLVYHLTAVSNLKSIQERGLLSRHDLGGEILGFKDVAKPDILEGRKTYSLDKMVPFHFICKSPFDYGVIRANPKEAFALLSVNRTYAQQSGWKILARHPLSNGEPLEILEWKEGISSINWNQMDRKDRDYSDNECKQVCMAEALSPTAVHFDEIRCIFVATEKTKSRILKEIGKKHEGLVLINPNMLPKGCP